MIKLTKRRANGTPVWVDEAEMLYMNVIQKPNNEFVTVVGMVYGSNIRTFEVTETPEEIIDLCRERAERRKQGEWWL